MNTTNAHNTTAFIVIGTIVFLLMTVAAAPVEPEEEPETGIDGNYIDYLGPWDSFNRAAIQKILLQTDGDERFGARVTRSWPPLEPRAWELLTGDGRLARQWRAKQVKRQVRFRPCFFNPISCFRK